MTWFWVLDVLCLLFVLAGAVLVVVLRTLVGAVLALSMTGTAMTLLFVVLGAPDVAHAEVVVGAIALPVLPGRDRRVPHGGGGRGRGR